MAASNLTTYERFEQKIQTIPECGCWIFTGSLNNKGYGQFQIKRNGKWGCVLAHRYSYASNVGEIGDLHVLHRCDTPSCCNPAHLFLGTHQDNMKDLERKGRGKKPRVRPKFDGGYKAKGTYRTKPIKVPNAEILNIRNMASSGMLQKDIAKIYGVTASCISAILLGKRAEEKYRPAS